MGYGGLGTERKQMVKITLIINQMLDQKLATTTSPAAMCFTSQATIIDEIFANDLVFLLIHRYILRMLLSFEPS